MNVKQYLPVVAVTFALVYAMRAVFPVGSKTGNSTGY